MKKFQIEIQSVNEVIAYIFEGAPQTHFVSWAPAVTVLPLYYCRRYFLPAYILLSLKMTPMKKSKVYCMHYTEKNSWSNFTQLPIKFGTYGQVRSFLLWKKDAFGCAGIQAQVLRLTVDCSDHWATQTTDIFFSTGSPPYIA